VAQWLAVVNTVLNPVVPQGDDGAPAETRVLKVKHVACVLMFATLKRELSKKCGFSCAEASGSRIRKVVASDLPVFRTSVGMASS
jgi:hypothetical protein